MKDLRQRCEKVFENCMGVPDRQEWKQIESFAREIRNEALLEAGQLAARMYGAHSSEITTAIRALKTDALAAKDDDK